MPFLFKGAFLLLLLSKGLATGLQFLTISSTAQDLIFFKTSNRNPAFLVKKNTTPELGLAYGNWLSGAENISLRWRGAIAQKNTGIDVQYLGINNIELRPNKPTSKPLGYYGSYAISVKGSSSFKIGRAKFGLGLKAINFSIYQENSSGVALDFGVDLKINDKMNFSISALNFGKMNALYIERPELPQRVIGITSYTQKKYSLLIAAESNNLNNDLLYHVGINSNYKNLIFGLNATTSNEVNTISSGVGIQLGVYTFAYGFQWGNQQLGMPQVLDISIRLP